MTDTRYVRQNDSAGARMTGSCRSPSKALATYVVLAFLCSWGVWIPVAFLFPDVRSLPGWALGLAFVGIYGPSIAALATAWRQGGRPELGRLLRTSFIRLIGWPWFAVVLFGPPALVWTGAVVETVLGNQLHIRGVASLARAAVILLSFIPFGPLGEELGWRGFMLPRLNLAPLSSSLVLGTVWAAWHAPAFWIAPVGLPARSIGSVAAWTSNILSFSVLLSYVARRTRYNVPIAMLFHATLNAGSAMGLAVLAAPQSVLHRVDRFALFLRWLATLAAGVALIQERKRIQSQA